MNRFHSMGYGILFIIPIILFLSGCGPTTDSTLSPPTIGKPIYNCAEIIAFGGADRDSKIIVYVNGVKATERNLWMGWGTIKLPSPLKTGDKVSAAQVVNNRISYQTREPVTVTLIPSSLLQEYKIKMPPEIVPPLYECQQIVKIKNVLHGATVVLRNIDGDTWKSMTPFNIVRMGTSKLKYDPGRWFNATQHICKDKPFGSDWSPKVFVQPKPSSLPAPKIIKKPVVGSDACRVDELVIGAEVAIFADDGSGEVKVGGGIALDSATIYKINPVADSNFEYFARQYLCDIKSPPSGKVPPDKEVPTPVILGPICDGEIYVTICNTAVLSTVKVYVDGTQVAQAAGNGDCITIALGDNTKFSNGKKVTAKQFVAGQSSQASAVEIVKFDITPAYDPAKWNSDPKVQLCNNCYNYANDTITGNFAQPGHASGITLSWTDLYCPKVGDAAIADGLIPISQEKACKMCTYIVALVVKPGVDYHWFRKDSSGTWSHKPGEGKATNLDSSGAPITDPATCNFFPYTKFCGYFCIDPKKVHVYGPGKYGKESVCKK